MFKIFDIGTVCKICGVKSIIAKITLDEYGKPFYKLVRLDNGKKYQLNNQQLQEFT